MKTATRPTISIIVPVYNTSPYLRDCLNSIQNQSFTDWEMLIVDDGSTDNSGLICDAYASRDPRIRVFHQENEGLSAARNKALDNAAGQYYTMVDSDDVLATPDYLQILYDDLLKNDADLCACGYIWFSDGAIIPDAIDARPDKRVCSGRDFYFLNGLPEKTDHLDAHGNDISIGYLAIGAHGKLYKREVFDKLRYPVGHILEDLAIAHRIYIPCEHVAISDKYMYAYRKRATGIMRNTENNIIVRERIFAYNDLLSFAIEIDDKRLTDYAVSMLKLTLRNNADL